MTNLIIVVSHNLTFVLLSVTIGKSVMLELVNYKLVNVILITTVVVKKNVQQIMSAKYHLHVLLLVNIGKTVMLELVS